MNEFPEIEAMDMSLAQAREGGRMSPLKSRGEWGRPMPGKTILFVNDDNLTLRKIQGIFSSGIQYKKGEYSILVSEDEIQSKEADRKSEHERRIKFISSAETHFVKTLDAMHRKLKSLSPDISVIDYDDAMNNDRRELSRIRQLYPAMAIALLYDRRKWPFSKEELAGFRQNTGRFLIEKNGDASELIDTICASLMEHNRRFSRGAHRLAVAQSSVAAQRAMLDNRVADIEEHIRSGCEGGNPNSPWTLVKVLP